MTRTWRRRALSSTAVATLILGAGVAALPTAAAAKPAAVKIDGLSFLPALQSMRSNTHKTLQIQLDAAITKQNGGSFTSMGVRITRHGTPEAHSWNFSLKNGSLKFNPATGKGSLHSAKQTDPYSKVTLSIRATGKKHITSCQTYKTITQPVKVNGSFSFNTKSKGKGRWGKVGGSKKRQFAGRSEVVYETGLFHPCGGNFVFPCSAGINWSVSHSGSGVNEVSLGGSITKVHGKNRGTLFADRNVSLSKPKNASRSDTVDITDNAMKFAIAKGLASVRLSPSGPVSGSATLISQAAGTKFPIPCGNAGKTQTDTSWTAPYKNGKSPLQVHEQIFGSLKLPNVSLSAPQAPSIDRDTVS